MNLALQFVRDLPFALIVEMAKFRVAVVCENEMLRVMSDSDNHGTKFSPIFANHLPKQKCQSAFWCLRHWDRWDWSTVWGRWWMSDSDHREIEICRELGDSILHLNMFCQRTTHVFVFQNASKPLSKHFSNIRFHFPFLNWNTHANKNKSRNRKRYFFWRDIF